MNTKVGIFFENPEKQKAKGLTLAFFDLLGYQKFLPGKCATSPNSSSMRMS